MAGLRFLFPVKVLVPLTIGLFISACTRSAVRVALPSPPARPTDEVESLEITKAEIPEITGELAIAWVERGDRLQLRGQAGIASEPQTALSYDQRGLRDLGQKTLLGSSLWIKVESPNGIEGWVPAWNTVEQIEAGAFCSDPRVAAALIKLRSGFQEQRGEALQELVSPERGLILRHDPWNPEHRIAYRDVPGLFRTPSRIWGERYISGTPIEGRFGEVFAAPAVDILTSESTESVCLDLRQGITQHQVDWPDEYVNIPYVSLYRPAPIAGNPFSWKTLAVGFEYVGGVPHVAVLLLIQPPI